MTRLQKKREDRKTFEGLTRGSWQTALAVVQDRIKWFDYVDASMPTKADQEVILHACRDFYEAVQPLVERNIDFEETAIEADQQAAS